ncbi:hypothetical protein LLH03_10800, partial [bacterium]|nr:hypothetical protein [bacterium]
MESSTVLFVFVLLVLLPVLAMSQPVGQVPGADESYLRYVHPTIGGPLPDTLDLRVPTELEDQRLAALGYLDVTKGPFRADPTGRQDCTATLQAAINFARDHQLVCFFPTG